MGVARSDTHVYSSASKAAASPWCYRFVDEGIVFVDCEYGIAYSTVVTLPTSITTALAHSTTTSAIRTPAAAVTRSSSSSGFVTSHSTASPIKYEDYSLPPNSTTSTSTRPTVVTTEGGIWVSGNGTTYNALASQEAASSSSVALYGNGTKSDNGNAYEEGPPSPLPIILSVIFGCLFAACAIALAILYHRRRKARKAGLLSPRRSSHEKQPPFPSLRRRLLGEDRRISLAGSGGFSLFQPEEIDSASPSDESPSTTLHRSMTTNEKRSLLREASRVERRAAEGDAEDDELAVVRRKLDTWHLLAQERRQAAATGTLITPVDNANSPFSDAYAAPGLQPPPNIRLPLTITTGLPGPRTAPPLRPPVIPVARSEVASMFSYTHTPTDLYPGPSPWSPTDVDILSPAPNSSGSEGPTSGLISGGTTMTAASTAPLLGGVMQEVDAGHLAGLRRFTLRDEQFGPEEVQPPAYRW